MKPIQAGTASVDITPRLGCHMCGYFNDRLATDIHDPLRAKALALGNGDTTIGFVVCDLIDVPAEVVNAAKERIRAATGVPPENVLICGTHTHTGPAIVPALGTPREEGYGEWVIPRIADAFVMATRRMQPAQVAHASGDCSGEVHNRRWHMKDGSVRMNPGYLNPNNVRPAGPTDPQLGLLIVRTPERRPLAVLGNLGLHYVGTSAHTTLSADYFAEFGRALQRCAGAEFMAILSNGCFGDINNCDFTRPARTSAHAFHQIERVAGVVAAEAWKAWNRLREEDFKSEVPLAAGLGRLTFKARVPAPEDLAAAQKIYAGEPKLNDQSFCPIGRQAGQPQGRLSGLPMGQKDQEWIYARELVLVGQAPSSWEVPVHAMRVGDLGVVGLHGEVFSEIGLDIKKRSPFPQTMILGLANGSVGYIATDQAMDEGSYETRLCRHVRAPKGTGRLWADTAVKLLEQIR